MDMKSNRLCMFSAQNKNRGRWTGMDKLPLQAEQSVKVWIKDLAIEVLLCKFVFTNQDGSTGEMYLLSNDLELSAGDFRTLLQKTVECGRISRVYQTERFFGQVANTNRDLSNQSPVCLPLDSSWNDSISFKIRSIKMKKNVL
jgi:hypothetical protein